MGLFASRFKETRGADTWPFTTRRRSAAATALRSFGADPSAVQTGFGAAAIAL